MRIRIFDIDDTLCDDGGTLDAGTIETLLTLKSQGELICFASARHWLTAVEALQEAELFEANSIVATENGACIYRNGRIVEERILDASEKERIAHTVAQAELELCLLDYWLDGRLRTVSKRIPCNTTDDKHREYVSLHKALSEMQNQNIRMIHYVLGTQEGHWMPCDTDKKNILRHIPPEGDVFLYGNGSNDIPLFSQKTNRLCTRYAIGNNEELNRLADYRFSSTDELLEHLKHS